MHDNMHNSDPKELAQFNAMAHDWWNPQGSSKPLHLMNPLRLHYIAQQTPLQGKKVLDVGCGGGLLSEAMAKAGATVTALELADQVLAVAQDHAEKQGLTIDYRLESVEDHAASLPGTYDVITCLEMLEHVPDPSAILRAIHTLLKPQGIAFFSTLNRHPMAFVQAIVGAEYVLKMLPKGTHRYSQFIKPSELDNALRDAHLHTTHIQGVGYNPLTEQFSFVDHVRVNYIVTATRRDASLPLPPTSHDENVMGQQSPE